MQNDTETQAEKLTAEEQATLDALVNPDAPREDVKIDWDFELQKNLLGAMLAEPANMKEGARLIEPKHFVDRAHILIAQIALGYWREYGKIPTKDVIVNEIDRRVPPGDDKERSLSWYFKGELDAVYQSFLPGLDTREYLFERLRRFATHQTARLALNSILDEIVKDKPDIAELFLTAAAAVRGKQESGRKAPLYWDWDEYEQEAERDKATYIVDGLLETGGLNVISGLSFSGKTVLMMYMAGAIITGDEFFGHYCRPTPIIYLNSDASRIRRIIGHLSRGRDPEQFRAMARKYFYPIRHEHLGKKLTPEFAEEAVGEIAQRWRETYNEDFPTPLIIVDTFRSALMHGQEAGGEIDSITLLNLMRPFQAYARDKRRTVLFLHHNARGTDQYAGAGSLPNLTDSLWNYQRDQNDDDPNARILTVQTRDGCIKIGIKYDPLFEEFTGQTPGQGAKAKLKEELVSLFGAAGNTPGYVLAAYNNGRKAGTPELLRRTLDRTVKDLLGATTGPRLVEAGRGGSRGNATVYRGIA